MVFLHLLVSSSGIITIIVKSTHFAAEHPLLFFHPSQNSASNYVDNLFNFLIGFLFHNGKIIFLFIFSLKSGLIFEHV